VPTAVNPDSPTATGAGRLQAMVDGRQPGDPSIAGKPSPQTGRFAFPNPPAPATSPVGRPPDGARAAMGVTQPQQPGTPAPAAAPASAPQAAPAGAPPPKPGSPSAAAGVGSPAAPAAPTVDQNGQATQTFASPTLPTTTDTPVPAGAQVQTPLGTVTASPRGQKLALDAAGQQRYKESMAALRSKFTVPRVLKGMTGLPQMDLKLGASNFDPFSGKFYGRE